MPPMIQNSEKIVALRTARLCDPASMDFRMLAELARLASLAGANTGLFGASFERAVGVAEALRAAAALRAASSRGCFPGEFDGSDTRPSGASDVEARRGSKLSSLKSICRASSKAWKALSSIDSMYFLFAIRLRLVTTRSGPAVSDPEIRQSPEKTKPASRGHPPSTKAEVDFPLHFRVDKRLFKRMV
ncbi:MAG: hypothetical protein KGI75_19360, partial [Rhizobiaceae bacterium]|nr:hypothetical protein [Rhizobiaceae bacterium]